MELFHIPYFIGSTFLRVEDRQLCIWLLYFTIAAISAIGLILPAHSVIVLTPILAWSVYCLIMTIQDDSVWTSDENTKKIKTYI